MSRYLSVAVRCDRFPCASGSMSTSAATVEEHGSTKEECEQKLRAKGWELGLVDYCPACCRERGMRREGEGRRREATG